MRKDRLMRSVASVAGTGPRRHTAGVASGRIAKALRIPTPNSRAERPLHETRARTKDDRTSSDATCHTVMFARNQVDR